VSQVITFTQNQISCETALAWVQEAFTQAKAQQLSIAACVVDINGRVKAKAVMDGAQLIADELVERKAKTALLGLSSQDLANAVEPSPAVVASMTSLAPLTLMGGGFPIVHEGQVIGGFAVGGALVEQDIALAESVMAAFA